MKKSYQKNNLNIHWDNKKCKHAAECVKNAGNVFKPKESPWIQPENGTEQEITDAIDKCPSGALTYSKE